ncbi:CypX Cytochrome P450 [Pyrenophora tritici-repentis]|uniref:CypX, Cytochrome P450 n=1 Tax=Pyrenophora tritici-repentis TaxID=45151 RepID=A0A317A588_9PLEO|nr:CypX Cytochrome P450 [Pyrenophora tritici-repentis]KAF7570107.1 CypX, Cytochrome P450 [Pyrenophora tritici-repentis]KAI0588949.1 CypX Cytochrome P450 [Pyrenophora tritici-repentis]KAI1550265.1 CypX Cytochrome P450 [Pyrenophora tritici-repentis]KAI1585277.1 CypX Cytochrome P450 [Pyrenophora tritici-repentis]
MSSKQYLDTATAVPSHDDGHTTIDTQLLGTLSQSLSTAAIAAFIFAVFFYIPTIQRKIQLSKLPVHNTSGKSGEKQRQEFLSSARKIYEEGYAKFKDRVYRVHTDDGRNTIVVPPSLLPELRKLPDDCLSFSMFAANILETKYTKVNTDAQLTTHAVKSDLTPALPRLNAMVCEEVDQAVREYMPPCDDWTEVFINQKLVDVVSKVSGAIFVGREMSQNPEYLDACSNYTVDLMTAVSAIKQVRPWLKPIQVPRLPEVLKLREREKAAYKLLQPITQERIHLKATDPNWQEPDDMVQWMINRDDGKESIEQMAILQLSLIFAAIHTTTMTATNILYTLVSTPEYINPLREEIRQVMAENGGTITFRALQKMEKLDSYMKEATRFYPTGISSFGRLVLKGFTLSNGQYIPPGVILEAPAAAMYLDEHNYPNADVFDGYRAYNLRASGKAADIARNQFVTTNEANLNFGYGRHACPGRFFATNEIKMVVARLILEYDIKMPEGVTERYPQIEIGRMTMPNPTKPLLFKKVVI